ncbi:hypothetical protein F7R20_26515 [Pseudomonas brassicacearum subsp. brassicacearum]|nr:hypothetical protein F7R20_26515 [Pseudomonas brassicacearum subsp. brassicacearum]
MPAIQATRFLKDRIAFIAGKPCSHRNSLATGLGASGYLAMIATNSSQSRNLCNQSCSRG